MQKIIKVCDWCENPIGKSNPTDFCLTKTRDCYAQFMEITGGNLDILKPLAVNHIAHMQEDTETVTPESTETPAAEPASPADAPTEAPAEEETKLETDVG